MPQNKRHFRNIFILLGVLASGCSSTNDKTTVAAPPQPASVPVALVAVPYQEAVRKAAQDLLANAKLPADQKFNLVIDPLVDGNSGMRTVATDAMEKSVIEIVQSNFKQLDVKPFNNEVVSKLPLIMVGTFTPAYHGKMGTELDQNPLAKNEPIPC